MPKLQSLNVLQLKEILRSHDLTIIGNKPELLARLMDALGTDEIDEVSLENILGNNTKLQAQMDELKAMMANMAKVLQTHQAATTGNNEAGEEGTHDQIPEQVSTEYRSRSQSSGDDISENGRPTIRKQYTVNEIAETIPEYDPTNNDSVTAEQFVQHVESAMSTYNFDERALLLALYRRLRGVARLWFDGQVKLFRTWDSFKMELLAEFGLEMNEAEINEKMVNTTRRVGEKIIDYCYRMSALGKKFQLSEAAIIKYTRSGLKHRELQNAIVAIKFTSLRQLREHVTEFSINNKEINRDNNHTTSSRTSSKQPEHRVAAKNENKNDGLLKCFNCNEIGHFSRDCLKSQRRARCQTCYKTTHTTDNCPQTSQDRPKIKKTVNKINDEGDAYQEVVKTVDLNGRCCRAFMDSGSAISLIQETKVVPSDKIRNCYRTLTGFGGGKYIAKQKITASIKIDDKIFQFELFIVPDNDIPEALLIGRDILCQSGNRFIIGNNICQIETRKIKNEVELDTQELDELDEILRANKACFATSTAELGKCSTDKIEIKLTSDQPVNLKPYRVAFAKRDIVSEIVKELLQFQLIRPSKSNYASPVVLVEKQNGEHRLCVDYRMLNKITVKTPFPMPVLEEQFAQLAGNIYFTTLDLRMGYHQIEVEESSKRFTAFITTDGLYEFNRMPFGLVNAPAVFQRVMNCIIGEMQPGEALAYLDDVIIPSSSVREGLHKLQTFLRILRSHGLTLRNDKCKFFQTEIQYLGHIVNGNGIRPGKKKVSAVENFPVPKTVTELRRFLGLTGFYRKFVPDYSLITRPLTQLLCKDGDGFKWSDQQQDAFTLLIQKLVSAPILELYDSAKYHEIHTDACSLGLAGVLLQSSNDTAWRPVMYFSRHCTTAEQKYHSYELEVLAIVETLERFRLYILGGRFRVVTDCAAIAMTKEKCELKPRVARWWLKIQEYDFEVVHRSGNRLAHVDAMSRAPVDPPSSAEPAGFILNVNGENLGWIEILQRRDERIQAIIEILSKGVKTPETVQLKQDYDIVKQRLYRKRTDGNRLVVPRLVRLSIVKHYHDDMGHFALEKTLQRISQFFWFPKMRKLIKDYINSCVACCYNKTQRNKSEAEMHFEPPIPVPFRTLHFDHLGPFVRSKSGNTHLLAISDAFTKFCILKAVRDTKCAPVVKVFTEVISYFGLPDRVITDRGTAFTAKAFENFCAVNNIKHIKTAVRTPRANGQVERLNATILDALRTSQTAKTWDADLGKLQWVLNSQRNSTTQFTPNELIFNYNVRDAVHNQLVAALHDELDPPDRDTAEIKRQIAVTNIDEEITKWKLRFDKRHAQPTKYQVGDLIVIKNEPVATGESRKMEPKFRGPYSIGKVLGNDRYVVVDIEGNQLNNKRFDSVYVAEQIKHWCKGCPDFIPDELPADSDADDEENCEGVPGLTVADSRDD